MRKLPTILRKNWVSDSDDETFQNHTASPASFNFLPLKTSKMRETTKKLNSLGRARCADKEVLKSRKKRKMSTSAEMWVKEKRTRRQKGKRKEERRGAHWVSGAVQDYRKLCCIHLFWKWELEDGEQEGKTPRRTMEQEERRRHGTIKSNQTMNKTLTIII